MLEGVVDELSPGRPGEGQTTKTWLAPPDTLSPTSSELGSVGEDGEQPGGTAVADEQAEGCTESRRESAGSRAESDCSRDETSSKAEDRVEKQRQRVKMEIISTERSYLGSLNTLVSAFVRPLTQHAADWKIQLSQIQTLFCNLEILARFHEIVLEDLCKEGANIPRVFVRASDFMRTYSCYMSNYPNAMQILSSLHKNKQLRTYLAEQQQRLGMDLNSYLIMPVQRIPRYELLLKELLKHTPQSHAEWPELQEALEKVHAVAQCVNERQRQAERMAQLVDLQIKITGCDTVLEPSRYLIREGTVTKISRSFYRTTEKSVRLLLFNDMMMWTSPSYKFKGSVSVMRLDLATEGLTSYTFQLKDLNTDTLYVFRTATHAEYLEWATTFERVLDEISAQNQTHVLRHKKTRATLSDTRWKTKQSIR